MKTTASAVLRVGVGVARGEVERINEGPTEHQKSPLSLKDKLNNLQEKKEKYETTNK
jgi:hypothetical protein